MPSGLLARYWAIPKTVRSLAEIDFSKTPDATGVVSSLDFFKTKTPFWAGGPGDYFAASYSGKLNITKHGNYTFYLTSDNHSELRIDGVVVTSISSRHTTKEAYTTLHLMPGQHDIEIRYFEEVGIASLRVEWSTARQLLEGDLLSHELTDQEEPPIEEPENPEEPEDPPDEDDHDHGGGHEHPEPPTDVEEFVEFVKNEPEDHAHGDNPGMASEHTAVLALVPRNQATHIVVASGNWFDHSIWYQHQIPTAGSKVLIPKNISVVYNGISDASIHTVRVDGTLSFSRTDETRIVLDTFVISPSGKLEIGTAQNQISLKTEILFADNGDINTAWDPQLISRGLISHGEVKIHGQEKLPFSKVQSHPLIGDTSLDLQEIPRNWKIGDTLVITGTLKQGFAWDNNIRRVIYHESQDEVRTITSVNGTRIGIDRPLSFNHTTPRSDLFAYVANMTRTVTFASINPSAVHRRAHTMFMHNANVDVRYAAFDQLGRTDKSRPARDRWKLATIVPPTENIKGRYSFHFHRTGATNKLTYCIGNTVTNSPGWGFTHHSSNSDFTDNISFDVYGAGFTAEDGDETGIWKHNLAIRSKGFDWGDWSAKNAEDVDNHDNGRTGDGFFFAGRLVHAVDNIAANCTHGYVWMHRSAPARPTTPTLDTPEIGYGRPSISPDHPPIQGFKNNEAFCTEMGLIVVKANPAQEHDVRSVFEGFKCWEAKFGVNLSYTAHYTLKDFDLIATKRSGYFTPEVGLYFGTNIFDMVVNNIKISGFPTGVSMDEGWTFNMPANEVVVTLIDPAFSGVSTNYRGVASRRQVINSSALVKNRLSYVGDAITIRDNQDLILTGTKTDSIGIVSRTRGPDVHHVPRWEVPDTLKTFGYHVESDGRKVLLLPDLIADRATGTLLRRTQKVYLNYSDWELREYTNHGAVED